MDSIAGCEKDNTVIALIEDNKEDIAALCRKYRIRRLDLFGSGATGNIDPEASEVDFIVDLGGMSAASPDDSFGSLVRWRSY